MNLLMICQSQQTSSIIGLISVASPIEILASPPPPVKVVVVNTTVIVATHVA
ncbi:hypothetical protein I4674_04440 [Proteus mirabilis]|nr:hypothetical protein [Proteus mirabilis]